MVKHEIGEKCALCAMCVMHTILMQQDVWPKVSTWPNANELVLMQDGAPPHYKREVRDWLNANFQDR